MVGSFAVGISVVAILFAGCATAPPRPTPESSRQPGLPTRWGSDLDAARARAGDRLVVVQFATRPEDRLPEDVAAHCELVRLDSTANRQQFRKVFQQEPGPGLCVMDEEGLVLAARLGPAAEMDLGSMLQQAELSLPLVRALATKLAGLPMRGQRDHRVETAFLLAEAYLVSGNPFAAYEHFTLVTLLAGDRAVSRRALLRACERLARLEIERGNLREAREWLAHLRDEDPSGTVHRREVQLTEAMVARADRQVGKARAILTDLRDDASNGEADRVWLEFGRVCRQSGRGDEARRAFRTVLSRFPDSRCREDAAAELRQLDAPQSPRK